MPSLSYKYSVLLSSGKRKKRDTSRQPSFLNTNQLTNNIAPMGSMKSKLFSIAINSVHSTVIPSLQRYGNASSFNSRILA